MEMGNPTCNLELSLLSPASSPADPSPPQPLTIFYNGRYSVCDVTEMQARAIIMLAGSTQLETPSSADDKSVTSTPEDPASPLMQTPAAPPPAVGLSMKRSLQRFLQKRKGRVQAAAVAPYSRASTGVFQKKELQFQINGFQIVAP